MIVTPDSIKATTSEFFQFYITLTSYLILHNNISIVIGSSIKRSNTESTFSVPISYGCWIRNIFAEGV